MPDIARGYLNNEERVRDPTPSRPIEPPPNGRILAARNPPRGTRAAMMIGKPVGGGDRRTPQGEVRVVVCLCLAASKAVRLRPKTSTFVDFDTTLKDSPGGDVDTDESEPRMGRTHSGLDAIPWVRAEIRPDRRPDRADRSLPRHVPIRESPSGSTAVRRTRLPRGIPGVADRSTRTCAAASGDASVAIRVTWCCGMAWEQTGPRVTRPGRGACALLEVRTDGWPRTARQEREQIDSRPPS